MDDKNSSTSGATEATAPAARAHNAGDGGAVAGGAKRFSAKRRNEKDPCHGRFRNLRRES